MAEKYVIVIGDRSTHGGVVTSGNAILEVSGKAVACVGDTVDCPLHGETRIIQGFPRAVIGEDQYLAYDGCLTSCGAQVQAGLQQILCVEAPDLVSDTSNEAPHSTHSETEFNLFVATIWGEGASQSEVAWQAIASVIMNRVGNVRWKKDNKNDSVTSVIYKTGFDAAKKEKNRTFVQASSYLSGNKAVMNAYEEKKMKRMIEVVKPIYYQKQTITRADHYFSPNAQYAKYQEELRKNPNNIIHPYPPRWLKGMQYVRVDGLKKTDDLEFYISEKN